MRMEEAALFNVAYFMSFVQELCYFSLEGLSHFVSIFCFTHLEVVH